MPTETYLTLIVDDEVPILDFLKKMFEKENFLVDCAASLNEAARFLKAKKYDLVLADIHLGSGTGIDLLRYIREYDKQIQVVLMTGQPDAESAAEALRLGAFDYLIKPILHHKVIGIAQRAMLSKRFAEENRRKQAHLDAIFRSVSDGIILVDRDNRLVKFNDAAGRFCGFTKDHLNLPIQAIETGCQGSCWQTLAKVLHDGCGRTVSRIECKRMDRVTRIISLSVSPVETGDGASNGAVAVMRDETELVFLEKQVHRKSGYSGIIGGNQAMQRMYTLIESLADVQTTVLVNGESGTGKELVAAALHHLGVRRDKSFVKVNCSALSEHLLESELFGHVRGAFTGAVAAKIGRFQKAHGGTIFLDEIGDISPAMQMRLLRVLQEQEFEPVGDSTTVKVDVRVIAATNQDLAEKVRLGTFRHDLYYRLNVVRLVVPPLRERTDDLPLLVEHFLEKFSRKFKKRLDVVTDEVMASFRRHGWPGNVRELEHVLEHAAILSRSNVISVQDLPQDFAAATLHRRQESAPAQEMTLAAALEKAEGNKAKAARILGVSRNTVYRKLQADPALAEES